MTSELSAHRAATLCPSSHFVNCIITRRLRCEQRTDTTRRYWILSGNSVVPKHALTFKFEACILEENIMRKRRVGGGPCAATLFTAVKSAATWLPPRIASYRAVDPRRWRNRNRAVVEHTQDSQFEYRFE